MCLIIHRPSQSPETLIPVELLHDAFTWNSDGWGIMYWHPKGVRVHKGFDLRRLILDAEEIQRENPDLDIFIHLRQATHGKVDFYNTHPFVLGSSGVYMMHNGIIGDLPDDKQRSDTKVFAEYITPLVEKDPDVIFSEGFQWMVEKCMDCSRIVFLHPDGRHVIVTDNPWYTWKGLVLSNLYAWTLYKQTKKDKKKKNRERDTRFNKHWSQYDSQTWDRKTDPYYDRRKHEEDLLSGDEDDNLDKEYKYTEDDTEYTLDTLLECSYQELERIAELNVYSIIDPIFNEGIYGIQERRYAQRA